MLSELDSKLSFLKIVLINVYIIFFKFESLERKIKAIDATSTAVGKPQENGHLEHFKEPLPNTNQHTSQGILLMMHFPDPKICRFKKK